MPVLILNLNCPVGSTIGNQARVIAAAVGKRIVVGEFQILDDGLPVLKFVGG